MPDLLIAGAGPAGLATALMAVRAGLSATVLDPRTGPIDKACGEGLMPGALRRLAGLGVDPSGSPIRGIRYTDGIRSVDTAFGVGPGRGVRRLQLGDALLRAAVDAGVVVEQGRVTDVRQDADGVRAGGLRARYLVAADGLHSPIRRRLHLDVPVAGAPRWGLRRHFTLAPWTDLVEVHWAADAEAYVTPVGSGQVGVAVLTSRQEPFDVALARFPALRARLPEATESVRGAGPLRQRSRRRVAGRVLLVGDAAGYVDALTGEGIAVALGCAEAVVRCLAVDDPQAYERDWARASRRYRVLTAGLLATRSRPALARRIVPTAARLPRVFGLVVDQLAH